MLYGFSHIKQFEDDLIQMFEVGIKNSPNKMNARKMRDNLINLYSGQFSIHGETQIKQLVFGKLSQKEKRQTQERRVQQNLQEEGR